jgi:TubC N-terminal docking domain
MTALELLALARSVDILLEVAGDHLVIDAPAGALTPELRAALAVAKPELLAWLEPATEFVVLKGGLACPAPALRLVWSLEDRGIRLGVDAHHELHIDDPHQALTAVDRAGLARWKTHVISITRYEVQSGEEPL